MSAARDNHGLTPMARQQRKRTVAQDILTAALFDNCNHFIDMMVEGGATQAEAEQLLSERLVVLAKSYNHLLD